jgi:hypothetical protein
MMRMLEKGVISKYRSRWWKKNQCATESKATILEMDKLSGIFVVYAGVMCLVIIISVFELLYVKHTQRKTSKKYREEKAEMSCTKSVSGDENTSTDTHI